MTLFYRRLYPIFVLFFIPSLLCAEPTPLLVELFTGSTNAKACADAEKILASLRQEYPVTRLIPLLCPVDGPLAVSASATRAHSYYNDSVKPTFRLNGVSKIAAQTVTPQVATSIRGKIPLELAMDSGWSITGTVRMKEKQVVSTARVLAANPPRQPLDLYCALIRSPRHGGDGAVRYFTKAAQISVTDTTAEMIAYNVDMAGSRQIAAVWFVQNPATKEILHSRLVTNMSDILIDLNSDGRITSLDLFTFTQWWKTSHAVFDLNRDSIVDGQDLARLIGEE